MRVVPVPVRSDNYAYLLIDESTKKAAAIDPFDGAYGLRHLFSIAHTIVTAQKVKDAAEKEGVTLGEQVITTHHHADHS